MALMHAELSEYIRVNGTISTDNIDKIIEKLSNLPTARGEDIMALIFYQCVQFEGYSNESIRKSINASKPKLPYEGKTMAGKVGPFFIFDKLSTQCQRIILAYLRIIKAL